MLAQVFQPFERKTAAPPENTAQRPGLSIVKYLVELMGGSISVNSAKGKAVRSPYS
ncbi:MAG: hypothetical protein ACLRXQ_10450 [Phascolarctobacterium faecium]